MVATTAITVMGLKYIELRSLSMDRLGLIASKAPAI